MANPLLERLAGSARTFREVFRNRDLRRVELALAGSITGQWAYNVGLAVFAYRHGGATAVGLVGLIRWIPAGVAAPFVASLADRFPRQRVMLTTDVLRAAGMGVAALLVFVGAPAGIVFGLAGFVQIVSTGFRPAQAALLPTLAQRPEELTAANVASSSIDAVGAFAGPAVGGLVLAVSSSGVVFVVTAAAFAWSALLIAGIAVDRAPAREPGEEEPTHRIFGGLQTIARERDVQLVLALFAGQTLVCGMLNVLIVVVALSLLDVGKSGVGFLNAAVGIGGFVGAAGALALVGRRRLASDFGVGLVFWGLPIALIGVWPNYAVALVLLAAVGIGNTLVDVTGLTLLQQTVRAEVLARVFGVLEFIFLTSLGVGAVIAPAVVSALGTRWTLVLTGVLLPALAVLSWRRLVGIDREVTLPERQLALLEAIPLFAPLPFDTLAHLARSLKPVEASAGSEIFHAGDHGDRFYVVDQGEVEIDVDGREPIREGAGGYFGEIALLHDVPRTATVSATTDVRLYALERDEFISAVTGHAASAAAADAVVGVRLGSLRPGTASI